MRTNAASDDDFDDLDEWLAPTQVAATQPRAPTGTASIAAAERRPSRAADERVLCAVCSLNLTMWTIQDRAVHMNACIDAMVTAQSKYHCPACAKELTDYNEQRRMAHVNICLDRSQTRAVQQESMIAKADDKSVEAEPPRTVESVTAQDEPDPNAYNCMICCVDLTEKDLTARIRHVKQCGQRFGVRPSDVAALQREYGHDQLPATDADQSVRAESATITSAAAAIEVLDDDAQTDASSLSTNAFSVMMRASSSAPSLSVLSNAIDRVGQVVSNAFDVLMKSSKTQAVLSSASVATTGSSFRSNPQPSSKRRRLNGGASSSGTQRSSSSSSSMARRFSCPDFKRIKGTHPPFIVDGFKYASKALSSVYFLTHFHSDHYVGLENKSFGCGVIYCNQITAALVVQELRIDAKWVHPVPINTPVTVHDVQVTFMDANHCPGAAIILFRLKNGQAYLHTGDFRYDKKMLSYAPLQKYAPSSAAATTRLDGIYLDTTYANPKYTFPTQQAAIDHTLELLATKHAMHDNKVLFLFGSYSIGKERLFMEVAAKYARKVCVSKAKLKIISTFGWPADQMKLLTLEPSATNLHVVPMGDLKMEHLAALLQEHRLRFREIVAFRPTGWTFSKASASISTCRTDASGAIRIYGIPYSEHSSFAELTEFVQAMNPHAIIPTVNCYTEQQAKKQVDVLRQSAFRSISTLFQQQQ